MGYPRQDAMDAGAWVQSQEVSDLQSGNSDITKEACARRITARVKAADTEHEQVNEMADRLQTKSAQTGTIPEEEQAEEESITVESMT